MIEALEPDVVLLDIQMPDLDGLRVLEALDDPPAIIFSTAHEQHAVKAFELEAVDYCLKPYSAERLGRAGSRTELTAIAQPQRLPYNRITRTPLTTRWFSGRRRSADRRAIDQSPS